MIAVEIKFYSVYAPHPTYMRAHSGTAWLQTNTLPAEWPTLTLTPGEPFSQTSFALSLLLVGSIKFAEASCGLVNVHCQAVSMPHCWA